MCDICRLEGLDHKFLNYPKIKVIKRPLYKVFKGSKAFINLCYIHDIELFVLGESKFLAHHKDLIIDLASNREKYSHSGDG